MISPPSPLSLCKNTKSMDHMHTGVCLLLCFIIINDIHPSIKGTVAQYIDKFVKVYPCQGVSSCSRNTCIPFLLFGRHYDGSQTKCKKNSLLIRSQCTAHMSICIYIFTIYAHSQRIMFSIEKQLLRVISKLSIVLLPFVSKTVVRFFFSYDFRFVLFYSLASKTLLFFHSFASFSLSLSILRRHNAPK